MPLYSVNHKLKWELKKDFNVLTVLMFLMKCVNTIMKTNAMISAQNVKIKLPKNCVHVNADFLQ